MSTIDEKLKIIDIFTLARRLKREFEDMKKSGIFNEYNDIDVIKNNNIYNKEYFIYFKNNLDKRTYKFIIPHNYPFISPRLELNFKPYSYYFKFKSDNYKDILFKYKGQKCYCCDSLLCTNNWGPQFTLKKIINEVNEFYAECKEIADRVIIDVIKRKYLIDDINIVEWLY